ncbi:MAG: hypothetical protein HRU14_05170, partial [Planctomycetes bacterium]|nr:hypothetical protein [Planctomycetota bacterium]
MSEPMPDLTNPGRASTLACVMAGILLTELALFGVLIVSFLDQKAATVDGLSDATIVGILAGPTALLLAAAGLHVRGAAQRREIQSDLEGGTLLLSWTYGD